MAFATEKTALEPQPFAAKALPLAENERIDSVTALDGIVYYSVATNEGGTLYAFDPSNIRAERVALGSYHAISLYSDERLLRFRDMPTRRMLALDPETGAIVEERDARSMTSFRVIEPGRIVATLFTRGRVARGNIPTELADAERRGQIIDARQGDPAFERSLRQELSAIADDREALGRFDVFELDANFTIVEPLLETEGAERILDGEDHRTDTERILGARRVRHDPESRRFLVFSQNRPGLYLFAPDGSLDRVLESPGEGMVLERPGSELDGQTIQVQRDVLLGRDHVLVVDNPSESLWVLDLAGRPIQRFATPFVVDNVLRDGDDLILRGAAAEIARYRYPTAHRMASASRPAAETPSD